MFDLFSMSRVISCFFQFFLLLFFSVLNTFYKHILRLLHSFVVLCLAVFNDKTMIPKNYDAQDKMFKVGHLSTMLNFFLPLRNAYNHKSCQPCRFVK